jgi:hypothetical protein
MRRKISEEIGYIIFYKISNLIVFGFLFLVIISHLVSDFRLILATIFPFIFIFFIIFWGLPSIFRLRKVELAEKGFFINEAGLFSKKEIFVPFENIKIVSQDVFQKGEYETITIEFSEQTEFGDEVEFFPKSGSAYWFGENTMVKELNNIIKQYKLENFDSK